MCFFFNDTATTEIYTLSLHDALPIYGDKGVKGSRISFKALKDAGAADVRYHEYKSQGHVIDDFAYFTDGFMEWMFSQKRKK